MAIAITNLTNNGDNTDRGTGDPYTTASVTLEAGRLYLLSVVVKNATQTPTVTSTGATWNLVESVDFDSIASPTARLCIFSGTVGSQQIGAISMEFASATTCCRWSVDEVTGHNTSSPIVQDTEDRENTGTSFSIDGLASFADAVNNAMYAAVVKSSTEATGTEGGHTVLADGSSSGAPGTAHLTVVWQLGEDLAPTFTSASSRLWGGIALEIAAASAGGGDVFIEGLHGIDRGVKALTAARMGGVIEG